VFGCWVLLLSFFGAGQIREWCTGGGGAPISTDAENVLLHSLRVLPLLMLLRVLMLLQLLLEERRAMLTCVVLLRRT
jgi:hypothetical protein